MENLQLNNLMILMGIIAIILEVILGAPTGYDLFMIGVIFLIGGGMALLISNFYLGLLIIAVFASLYIFLLRRIFKNRPLQVKKKS